MGGVWGLGRAVIRVLSGERKARVEQDFEEGRIDKREYEIRRDQIQRDSVIQ